MPARSRPGLGARRGGDRGAVVLSEDPLAEDGEAGGLGHGRGDHGDAVVEGAGVVAPVGLAGVLGEAAGELSVVHAAGEGDVAEFVTRPAAGGPLRAAPEAAVTGSAPAPTASAATTSIRSRDRLIVAAGRNGRPVMTGSVTRGGAPVVSARARPLGQAGGDVPGSGGAGRGKTRTQPSQALDPILNMLD